MLVLDPVKVAQLFATTKHEFFSKTGNPQRYCGLPYTHHLSEVVEVLEQFGWTRVIGGCLEPAKNLDRYEEADEMRVAGWLHDSVEDTYTKLKEIEELFGDRVAELVGAVTNEPGANRKIRAALTYPKIRACKGAVGLKLADRIANVKRMGAQFKMYQKEYEDFKRALYSPGEYEDMWAHLDKLMKGE